MASDTPPTKAELRRFRRLVALLVLVAVVPNLYLWRYAEQRADEAQRRVTMVTRDLAVLEKINDEVDTVRLKVRRMEGDALLEASLRNTGVPAATLLATLSATLPAESSIERLSVTGDAVELDVRTTPARAEGWRDALSKRKEFTNVAFAALPDEGKSPRSRLSMQWVSR